MERARWVQVDEGQIGDYAGGLLEAIEATPDEASPSPSVADPEHAAAFAICMNAINFGSGWWPTIRKRPGHSGYSTMAAGVSDRFAEHGP